MISEETFLINLNRFMNEMNYYSRLEVTPLRGDIVEEMLFSRKKIKRKKEKALTLLPFSLSYHSTITP
jgi:hypothetical protein